MKKTLSLILALVLVAGISVVGTLAYMSATTDEVTNTFTVGNIGLELKEYQVTKDGNVWTEGDTLVTENSYENIYPGAELPKTPVVTVDKNSEDCYLYVLVDNQLGAVAEKLSIGGNWTVVKSEGTKTLYRYTSIVEPNGTTDTVISDLFTEIVIKDDADLSTLPASAKVELTAYAHQAYKGTDSLETTANAAAIAQFFGD